MRGPGRTHLGGTAVSKPAMVPSSTEKGQRAQLCIAKNRPDSIVAREKQEAQVYKHANGGIPLVRECLTSAGLPADTADIIMQSWRPSTTKQYGTYLQRWVYFCQRRQVDKINPSLEDILSFLTRLHDDGLCDSAVNTAKSMLSSIF